MVEASGLEAGATIAGRFRVERRLGKGAMAEVYAVLDLALKRRVALKVLRPELAGSDEAMERLRREGEVLNALHHPAIVALETYGKLEDGRVFIAMELLEGQTLGHHMRSMGKLEPESIAPVVSGTCAALAAAHAGGVVHRDLKPDNIFLVPDGSTVLVKLLDFGISKVFGNERLTHTGQVLGTPRYMAPEQLSADRDLDGRTDVYALGVILYEALAGLPPFVGATPTDLIVAILNGKVAPLSTLRQDISPELAAVVARAMARAREARFATAKELGKAYLSALGHSGATPNLPEGARPGMSTVAMGSMLADSDTEEVDEDLAPGTFRDLERQVAAPQAQPVPAAAPAQSFAKPQQETVLRRPRSPDAEREVRRAPGAVLGGSSPEVRGEARRASVHPSGRKRARASRARRWRALLIFGGVAAGAISAVAAIVVLEFNSVEEDGHHAPTVAPELRPAPAPLLVDPLGASVVVHDARVSDEGAPDAGARSEGVPDAGRVSNPSRSRARRRRARAKAGGGSMLKASAASPAGTIDPWSSRRLTEPFDDNAMSATDRIRGARTALGRGDTQRCLDLLDHTAATPAVLRLRGDCLMRAGDRGEALKAYERFCRRAATHPDIGVVRELVAGLGGRCP